MKFPFVPLLICIYLRSSGALGIWQKLRRKTMFQQSTYFWVYSFLWRDTNVVKLRFWKKMVHVNDIFFSGIECEPTVNLPNNCFCRRGIGAYVPLYNLLKVLTAPAAAANPSTEENSTHFGFKEFKSFKVRCLLCGTHEHVVLHITNYNARPSLRLWQYNFRSPRRIWRPRASSWSRRELVSIWSPWPSESGTTVRNRRGSCTIFFVCQIHITRMKIGFSHSSSRL